MKGIITQIQHFSLHDGPGIRTTLFFKGCNLRCRWCHNPENIRSEPETLVYKDSGITVNSGYEASTEKALEEILKDRMFYEASGGGVTFSGGEPTQQIAYLRSLAEACRAESIHTVLNSNFTFSNRMAKELADQFDLFVTDVKITDPERHRRFTGQDNARILANIRYFADSQKPLTLRFPLVHGINTDEESLEGALGFLSNLQPYDLLRIEILPYHRFGESKYAALGRDLEISDAEVPLGIRDQFVTRIAERGFQATINTW